MLAGSNIFPHAWNRTSNRLSRAGASKPELHARLLPATDALYAEPNPAPLKAAMKMLGMPAGSVIAPMLPASAACVSD